MHWRKCWTVNKSQSQSSAEFRDSLWSPCSMWQRLLLDSLCNVASFIHSTAFSLKSCQVLRGESGDTDFPEYRSLLPFTYDPMPKTLLNILALACLCKSHFNTYLCLVKMSVLIWMCDCVETRLWSTLCVKTTWSLCWFGLYCFWPWYAVLKFIVTSNTWEYIEIGHHDGRGQYEM